MSSSDRRATLTALRESEFDEDEEADILMVKPALMDLDVIQRLHQKINLPMAASNVSGEYSMLIAQAERGWGDLCQSVCENVAGRPRTAADMFVSYWANRYNELRKEG